MSAEGIVGEYQALKRETDADLLAMQMGDFYEFFADDARTVGEELDLKVSERSSGGEMYEMAGVPRDDLAPYLKALVERGYRVAVADQHEVDGGHERAIERVVTPGTLLEPSSDDAQYLASVVREGDEWGLAFLDVTTGRFRVTTIEGEAGQALTELYRFAPTEILPGPALRGDDDFLDALRERSDATLTLHATDAFAPGRAKHALREQFGAETAESVGLDAETAIRAAGAAIDYVEETGVGALASVTRLGSYRPDDHVELDATTQRNLELTETMTGGGRSLFETVDHTETSAGGRLLREWLARPLQRRGELERRQACVEAFTASALAREELRDTLDAAYDLERLGSRAASGSADPAALVRVRETLGLLPDVVDTIDADPRLSESPAADLLADVDRETVAEVHAELRRALVDDPPRTVTEGGLFRQGYDEDLDELLDRHAEATEWIDTLSERESEAHGITHLSVGRNKTDGYYIQVGKSESEKAPDHYEGIKTLKNAERYVTDELDEREREILRLEERRGDLEAALFEELCGRIADHADLLQHVGRVFAELDALASLATHAVKYDWTNPELTDDDVLDVEAGRHPVVEQTTEFVPNDLRMDADHRFLLVTGPNMSGKSTYMRQAALITLLAQVGSFVPAHSATIGLVDGIYTRVGALDELAQGRSTFMVEMQELSNILHSATEDSLVILDEVGRGTATYDGISIAWAATEYLSSAQAATPSPKVLFATHYHELTSLADHIDGVENVHVAADERDGEVTFLRTVREGPTDRSYGIHVAELAGVPDPVVSRAEEVLTKLREDEAIDVRGSGGQSGETQQVVFDLESGQFKSSATADGGSPTGPAGQSDGATDGSGVAPEAEAILDQLRETNVNETPPVELMAKVQEWQEELDEE